LCGALLCDSAWASVLRQAGAAAPLSSSVFASQTLAPALRSSPVIPRRLDVRVIHSFSGLLRRYAGRKSVGAVAFFALLPSLLHAQPAGVSPMPYPAGAFLGGIIASALVLVPSHAGLIVNWLRRITGRPIPVVPPPPAVVPEEDLTAAA